MHPYTMADWTSSPMMSAHQMMLASMAAGCPYMCSVWRYRPTCARCSRSQHSARFTDRGGRCCVLVRLRGGALPNLPFAGAAEAAVRAELDHGDLGRGRHFEHDVPQRFSSRGQIHGPG